MKPEAERSFFVEEQRHLRIVHDLIKRFPAYRSHYAYGLLGSAIALCDSYGIDVDDFIAHLRKTCPRPA